MGKIKIDIYEVYVTVVKGENKIMKKFEYCFISSVKDHSTDYPTLHLSDGSSRNIKEKLSDILNELGEDGWEMVGCGYDYENHNIYFKKQI